MPFPLFLATRYLKPNRSAAPAVTLLAVLGVVLGVAIVIVVRAVMTGFGDLWREKILAFKPHITITSTRGVIEDDAGVVAAALAVDGVEAASASVEMRVLAEHDRHVQAPAVIGIGPDDLAALHPDIAGALVAGDASALAAGDALIGEDLAYALDATVGDAIIVHSPASLVSEDELYFPEEIRIGAIYRMGQAEFDGGYIIVPIGFARDLVGLARGGAYSVHLKTDAPQDPTRFTRIRDGVDAAINAGAFPPPYAVRDWREIDSALFNAIAVEKNMMVILLMFITVVAIFCVTNTIIVVTIRKTREIGLLKALGFDSRRVMAAFVLYGTLQCVAGTALGVGLAFLVLHNLQGMVDGLSRFGVEVFPKSVYGLDHIPWRVIPGEVAQTVAMVIGFCCAASVIPAWRAASRRPAEALRS
ncbi:MAG: ABC transporter permease [Kiritimatiellae bacterium]|nr:ABC transporter permease [Kiritimatiellia bacterium]